MLFDKLKKAAQKIGAHNDVSFIVPRYGELVLWACDISGDTRKNQEIPLYSPEGYPVAYAQYHADKRNQRLDFLEYCCGEGRVFYTVKL